MRAGQLTHRTCPSCHQTRPWHLVGTVDGRTVCIRCSPHVTIRAAHRAHQEATR